MGSLPGIVGGARFIGGLTRWTASVLWGRSDVGEELTYLQHLVAFKGCSAEKKRRHERCFVRAGRPVTQLALEWLAGARENFREICSLGEIYAKKNIAHRGPRVSSAIASFLTLFIDVLGEANIVLSNAPGIMGH